RADSLGIKLGIIRHAPSAISLDKQWTRGVPGDGPAAGRYLKEKKGHDFPVLSRLRNKRAVRAIPTMLRDQFADTVLGLDRKLAAGLISAETAGAPSIADWLRAIGARPHTDAAVEVLARAVSPRLPVVDPSVLQSSRALPAAGIVEIVTFIALLQLLHRLE